MSGQGLSGDEDEVVLQQGSAAGNSLLPGWLAGWLIQNFGVHQLKIILTTGRCLVTLLTLCTCAELIQTTIVQSDLQLEAVRMREKDQNA